MIRFRSVVLPILLMSSAAMTAVATPAAAQFAVDIRVNFAPPPLPVYVQPPLPGPDYLWTPGFWAWDPGVGDYYWVPGTWVRAPRPGYLWTPAWWGWDNGVYLFHSGYWGPHVGFYGGIAYGFGYTGVGFFGGRWDGDHFAYNRVVNNITNVHVTNVYEQNVTVNRTAISYNGGPSGVQAQASPAERAAENGPRLEPTSEQVRHVTAAQGNRQFFAAANHGVPPVAATARPAVFRGPDIARAGRPGGAPPPLAPRPAAAAGMRPADHAERSDFYGGGGQRGGDPYAGRPVDQGNGFRNDRASGGDHGNPHGGDRPHGAGYDGPPPPPHGQPHPPAPPRPPHPQGPRPQPQPHGQPHPEHHDDHH